MRLWSDTIEATHLHRAMQDFGLAQPRGYTDVWMEVRHTTYKSRRRAIAHDLYLTGTGARHTRYVNLGTAARSGWSHADSEVDKAATWMDWGWILAVLFRFDPDMQTPYYADRADFLATTARDWPHRLKLDRNRGAGDFARTYAARTYASPFELVNEVIPPVHLVDLTQPEQVRAWIA